MQHREARYINLALGIWLVASAFLWRHSGAQRSIALVTGIVVALVAVTALGKPRARFINVGLAVWLVVSAFAFPHPSVGTMWNNIFVGSTVFFLALLGPDSERRSAGATG